MLSLQVQVVEERLLRLADGLGADAQEIAGIGVQIGERIKADHKAGAVAGSGVDVACGVDRAADR